MDHPIRSFRSRFLCCLLLVLTAAFAGGCSARINPWVDGDKGQLLAEKIKTNKYAYLRYAQAEEEARRDGNQPAAERYRQAKEESQAAYQGYEKELATYQAEKGANHLK